MGIESRDALLVCMLLFSVLNNKYSGQTITTIAGIGTAGYSGDGFQATVCELNLPEGVFVYKTGNLYIAEQLNHVIRKVNASNGIVTTIAGNGIFGYSGDGGAATSATTKNPTSVSLDSLGNVFFVDAGAHVIRKISASTGIITTIAGNGTPGFSGDGGLAINAKLSQPWGICIDDSNNLYVSDYMRVRRINATSGIITTIAGNGTNGSSGDGGIATNAQLSYPSGLAVDHSGNLYIVNEGNSTIRKVTFSTGIISTIAGNGGQGYSGDGGVATNAQLNQPYGVAVDGIGNIYIADRNNNRIRKVNALTGLINTVAGNGTYAFSGDGGLATSAELSYPTGISIDTSGNLYIADRNNHRIRKVTCNPPNLTVASSSTLICSGTPVLLSAFGADSYSWNASQTTSTIIVTPTTSSVYQVTGFNDFASCSIKATISISVSECIGITERKNDLLSVSVFPNPSDGEFTLLTQRTSDKVEVLDDLGRLIFATQLTSCELKISIPNEGIYLLRVAGSGDSKTLRMAVVR